jgi:hypothetical protein
MLAVEAIHRDACLLIDSVVDFFSGCSLPAEAVFRSEDSGQADPVGSVEYVDQVGRVEPGGLVGDKPHALTRKTFELPFGQSLGTGLKAIDSPGQGIAVIRGLLENPPKEGD